MSDDTKQVASIIREAWNACSVPFNPLLSDADVCHAYPNRATAVRLALQAGRAAASSEPRTIPPLTDAEVKDAFDSVRARQSSGAMFSWRDWDALPDELKLRTRELSEHHYALAASRLGATVAAPVPEPPHVMVNGWRVTWDGTDYRVTKGEVSRTLGQATDVALYLSAPEDRDRDVVRVLALREGRGDDAV